MYSSPIKMVSLNVGFLLLALQLIGCSEGSNFNQFFVSKKQKDSLASLIEQAQIAYDRAKFSDALTLAEKAEAISPKNEQIGVLLGYIHLALTGMDTFTIADALIEATAKEKAQSKTALASGSSSIANILFGTIVEKMSISDDDLRSLGDVSVEEDLSAYKDYPVILPESASDARDSGLNVFEHINKVVEKVCPFVDEDVRLKDFDARVNDEHCTATEVSRERAVIAHFLWGFAHIVEAAVFYSVVQYKDNDGDEPNIRMRAESLKDEEDSLSIGQYALHTVSLAESVNAIYDFTNEDSQFNAIVYDLTATSLAFSKIGRMPKKIRKSLDKTVDAINETKTAAGDSQTEKKANALKSQLNSKMSESLASKISELAEDNPDEFAENKEDLCGAYETLSGSTSKPDACED